MEYSLLFPLILLLKYALPVCISDFFAQPQCNIVTGQIVGAEALVRWQKPDGEVFLPGGFIPVLEKNKMIDQLDRYVWEKVCQWLKGWLL